MKWKLKTEYFNQIHRFWATVLRFVVIHKCKLYYYIYVKIISNLFKSSRHILRLPHSVFNNFWCFSRSLKFDPIKLLWLHEFRLNLCDFLAHNYRIMQKHRCRSINTWVTTEKFVKCSQSLTTWMVTSAGSETRHSTDGTAT